MGEPRVLQVGDPVRHIPTGDIGKIVRIDERDGQTWLSVEYRKFGYGYEEAEFFEYRYDTPAPAKASSQEALKFECPKCGAGVDQKCQAASGETDIHAGRKALVTSDGN